MPIQLINTAYLSPSPTPSLYQTNIYRREDVKAAFTSRLMIMGPDMVERVLVNTPTATAGRWNTAAYWAKETDYATYVSSSTLAYSSTLYRNDSDQWFYNGVELNTASGGVGGSGTPSYLPKWTTATTLGNSQIYDGGSYLYFYIGGAYKFGIGGGIASIEDDFVPNTDNAHSLGYSFVRWSNIWAVTTHFGDLGFEETSCAVCSKRFRRGDSISFIIKSVRKKGIVTVPKHSTC
jgi:hypothetical protein